MNITSEYINTLLIEMDIEGLIADGAPSDEYESEAQAIFESLSQLDEHELTQRNVLKIIDAVWMQSFNLEDSGLGLRQLALNTLANRIIDKRHGA
jgi:hypothetical protein